MACKKDVVRKDPSLRSASEGPIFLMYYQLVC